MIEVPAACLVVLVGVSGAGKSSFARRSFHAYEALSSDTCRGMITDDEGDQSATPQAFELLRYIADKRLARGRLTVVDATNLKREDRDNSLRLARKHHVPAVAIVFNMPVTICIERDRARRARSVGSDVIYSQHRELLKSLQELPTEGFEAVHVLRSADEIDTATVSIACRSNENAANDEWN
jgi:predicted kinase